MLDCEKKDQFLREFLDPTLTFKCPPGVAAKMTSPIWYCFVFWLLRQYLSTDGVEDEITPLLYTTSIMQLFFKRRRHGFGCIFKAGRMLSLLSVH